jgi:hypothetical protein
MSMVAAFLDRLAHATERRSVPAWGDGIVEQSLHSRWSLTSWDDVSPDELVYFIPSLASARMASERRSYLALLVRDIVAARAWVAAPDAPGCQAAGNGEAQHSRVLWLARTFGQAASYGRIGARHAVVSRVGVNPAGNVRVDHCLAGLLATLECENNVRACESAQGLGELVAYSIATGINAAYFAPEYGWAHEFLLSAAWLGQVARGRPALMPLPVADCLGEVLSPHASSQSAHELHSAMARLALPTASISSSLLSHASRVSRRKLPILYSPTRHGAFSLRSTMTIEHHATH